ncbi:MAG TPA: alkaline phosphatase family protein [Candidatus Tumulicola sp.]|nr:alkaline phosphatase family protein [Candidatus Tumulicola sp.]
MLGAALSAALLSACAQPATSSNAVIPSGLLNLNTTSSGKIQHIIVIVQENRSFDDLFQGYPGADTQSYGYTSKGKKVKLHPIGLTTPWDIDHSAASFFKACDGSGSLPGTNCKMDGFDQEYVTCGTGNKPPCPYSNPMYAFVPHSQTKPYFAMASQYVLADRMFASNFDGSSFVSHQYLIAGQASSSVDYPESVWGCDGGPQDTIQTLTQQRTFGSPIQACFDNETLGDEMDAASISWKYYTASVYGDGNLWNAYQAIRHIRYGPDWKKHVIYPQKRFLKDVANGVLPAVSWITPTCENSDHAGCVPDHGPQWVTTLVNAVGNSKYWNSSAIFIMWDDFGGWYDHVPPPLEDYDGLGIRVPLIIVSPYAKQGYVSHVQYEHGSILRFIEDQFGLARLAPTDTRATSPAKDCFNFSQSPRSFTPFHTALPESYFLNEPLDMRPVDTE